MKKIVIFFTTIILLIASVPIIGNQFIEGTLNDKIQNLKLNGLGVNDSTTQSSYLVTKKHYEFFAQDVDKFIAYLNRYSDEQLPPYVNAALDGAVVGVDLEYSNLPFIKDVSIDLYPLSLSKPMKAEIKKEDAKFSEYLESFLQNRGVLYHVDYDMASESFKGYVKDIDERHTLEDSTKLHLKLKNAIYSGKGELIAPTQLNSSVSTISLEVEQDSQSLDVELNNFTSFSDFKSHSSYVNAFGLQSVKLTALTQTNEKIILSASNVKVNVELNTEGKRTWIGAKNSLQNLYLSSKDVNFKAASFIYDASLEDMDKDSFEALRVIASKLSKNSSNLEDRMKNALVELFSKGLKLNVSDFSLNEIVLSDAQNLGSTSLGATLVLKEDSDLAKKIDQSLLLLTSSVDMDVKFKLSKKIFGLIERTFPMATMIKNYAKEDGVNLIYDVSMKNGEFRVNGKAL